MKANTLLNILDSEDISADQSLTVVPKGLGKGGGPDFLVSKTGFALACFQNMHIV